MRSASSTGQCRNPKPQRRPSRPNQAESLRHAALTRRRDRNLPQDPGAAPKWQWRCGFYPGSRPGECTNGTAATFDQARADFEKAWRVFLSKRTEADFQAWRDQRDWTARKYARWANGERHLA